MDKNFIESESESKSIDYFACNIVQGSNRVFVPIPIGALEDTCRALLSINSDSIIEVRGLSFLKF